MEIPLHSFGIRFALFQDMNFYPVYRLCRSNGSFSRIGSLLAISPYGSTLLPPHNLKRAEAYFEQKPVETILLGPRCGPVGKDVLPDEEA